MRACHAKLIYLVKFFQISYKDIIHFLATVELFFGWTLMCVICDLSVIQSIILQASVTAYCNNLVSEEVPIFKLFM